MKSDAAHMLNRLNPPIRPTGGGKPRVAFDRRGFGELLMLASSGQLESGEPVTSMLTGDGDLSEEQLKRLAAAADLAESAGFRTALMLIDGRCVILEVESRQVTGEMSPREEGGVVDLDGAVFVAGDGDEVADGSVLKYPGSGLVPPAVANLIGSHRSKPDDSEDSPAAHRPAG